MEVSGNIRQVEEKVTPLFRWEIDVTSFREKKMGDYLDSPEFYSHYDDSNGKKNNDNWKLSLYPKGDSKETENYLAL